jgi:nitrite reductase/ring-hydroxylating ferredoxin subunit
MRRARGLVEYSRREFCAIVGATVGATVLAGCTDGGVGAIQTGSLGGGDDSPPIDAPGGTGGDAAQNPDAMMAPVCSGSPTDVGAPTAFTANTPVYFSGGKFFVVRDAGGVYAVSAACTHEGAICAVSSGKFRCPRHGAQFTINGAIVSGPVNKPLVHYSMCTMASGHLGVMVGSIVPATTRLNA